MLQSAFLNSLHRFCKGNLEVSGEKDFFLSVFLLQEIIEDPCGRRLAVCSCDREDFEPFRKMAIDEVEFSDNLACLVDSVRWSDPRRGNDSGVV